MSFSRPPSPTLSRTLAKGIPVRSSTRPFSHNQSNSTSGEPKKVHVSVAVVAGAAGAAGGLLLASTLQQLRDKRRDADSKSSSKSKPGLHQATVGELIEESKRQGTAGIEEQQPPEAVKPAKELKANEVVCFVLGSGIDASHAEFEKGQVWELSDPADDSTPILQEPTFRLPKPLLEEKRLLAHETAVASIIGGKNVGASPGTTLVDVRLPFDGLKGSSYTDEDILRRFRHIIKYVKANPEICAVLNMSLGTSPEENYVGPRPKSMEEWKYPKEIQRKPKRDDLIKELHERGILTVVGSGNESCPSYTSSPNSCPYVLTVGAVDAKGKLYPRNNMGADLLARGVNVHVAHQPPNEYRKATGTSYAGPYIAGYACALLKKSSEIPVLQKQEIRAGALKSIMFNHFDVSQQILEQDDDARKRSDGLVWGSQKSDEPETSEDAGKGEGEGEGEGGEDNKEGKGKKKGETDRKGESCEKGESSKASTSKSSKTGQTSGTAQSSKTDKSGKDGRGKGRRELSKGT